MFYSFISNIHSPAIKTAPKRNIIYSLNLFLDIVNSSTITSLALTYKKVPPDNDKNIPISSELEFSIIIPIITPNGVNIANKIIILK